jgi:hypothetical protein
MKRSESSDNVLRNPRDHEIVGILVSILLSVGLAVAGALLAGGRGVPDALILAGVLGISFCGFITLALVAVARKRAVRQGWPRAAKGALWASAAAAILNGAFWIVALLAARSRWDPKHTVSTVPTAQHRQTVWWTTSTLVDERCAWRFPALEWTPSTGRTS